MSLSNYRELMVKKYDVAQRILLAIQIGQLPDDTMVGPAEMAALTNSTINQIQKLHARQPERLPPISGIGGRTLRWHLGTARKWLRDHATAAPSGLSRRVGHPRQA